MNSVDYTILSTPEWERFVCPYCKQEVIMPFYEVDYKTECWSDGAWVTCDECGQKVELGYFDYQ